MQKPIVSIIVPVYNVGETLRRCLDSLLQQSCPNIEIIVINDASDNRLDAQIIADYSSRRSNVISITLEENITVGMARNRGIECASGKYIGFVDADDYVDEHMFDQLVARMEKDGSDLAACRRIQFDSKGMMKPIGFRDAAKHTSCVVNESPESQVLLMEGLTPFVWDKLYKRDIIVKNDIRMPSTRYSEDCVFVMTYLDRCKKVSFVDQPLYYYNCESITGVTNNFSASWLDIVPSMQILVDYYKTQGTFEQYHDVLLNIAIGTFARRAQRMYLYAKNRKMQMQFIKEYRSFFDKNFRNTKDILNERYREVSKFYTPWRAYLYILRPNFLKINPRLLKKIRPQNLRKRFGSAGARYVWHRKYSSIKKGQIFFISNSGAAVVDSPFYLMKDACNRKDLGLTKIVTPSEEPAADKAFLRNYNLSPKVIRWGGLRFAHLLASSEYLVTTTMLPTYFSKRSGQYVLNTWHGTPLKTLGYSMETPWKELSNTQAHFLQTDYLLYPNEDSLSRIMNSYYLDRLFTNKVILLGYPRTIALLDSQRREDLRKKLGLHDKRIFIYMPTWRGKGLYQRDYEQYQGEIVDILRQLEHNLADDVVVYVKLHRYMAEGVELEDYHHVKQFPAEYETYDFLNVADGLITDYSSVLFDYAVTKRPIFLFMYDYDDYISGRGVYEDPRSFPFPQAQTASELARLLNECDISAAASKSYEDFVARFCPYDSSSSAHTLNTLFIGKRKEWVNITDYSANTQQSWRVIFADNILDREAGVSFISSGLRNDDLLVVSSPSYSEKIENWIRREQLPCAVLIVPGEGPKTPLDLIGVVGFSRFGKFEKLAQDYYRVEKNRILPGINIREIVNFSDTRRFKAISYFFNKEQGDKRQ